MNDGDESEDKDEHMDDNEQEKVYDGNDDEDQFETVEREKL